ncbi:MAG: glycosyltransferase family 4 protein [Euryarchaeota archaeon]|nr:glycosyltransferase family 4 protein [Euryarchaeota archaeon]
MFTDSYHPSKDGVVNSIVLTKQELERRGHEVFIFAPDPWDKEDRESDVYYFRSTAFKSYPGYTVPIYPTNKCEILSKLDVDIIHSHGLLFMGVRSMFAARTLAKPVVVTFHTMITEAAHYYARLPIPEWMTNRLFWIYLRQLLERADAVVAPTDAIRKELLNYAPDMNRVDVIPTGVDCRRFSPSNDGSLIRQRYGLEDNKIIMHVGRVAREKNLELLLEGFSYLLDSEPAARLVIVGAGPAKKYYMELANENGLSDKVVFTGFVPDSELADYYAACDAFAISSKFETQGLAALEAMASGKPVAGINYRAIAEMVQHGKNGFLFEDEPNSCAEAMQCALNCSNHIYQTARATAESYSVDESVTKLLGLYDFAIEHKKREAGGRIF